MTKPTPRKMRDEDGRIHDEYAACTLAGCVPVEPEPSRSVQRRVAVQKGESTPTFEPQEPGMSTPCSHCGERYGSHRDATLQCPPGVHGTFTTAARAIPEAELQRVANQLADMWFGYCKNPSSYEEKGTNREVFVKFAVKAMRTLEKKA